MGRAPCCDKANVKKGPWSPEEDSKLKDYIEKYGTGGNWIALPQKAGLRRCGKSCRLRWLNYLRPNIKHGEFSDEEDRIICTLFANIGSRWSIIAAQLPGRTDNDIKNYWNTKLKKKLMGFVNPLHNIHYNNNNNNSDINISQRKLPVPFHNSSHETTSSPSSSSSFSLSQPLFPNYSTAYYSTTTSTTTPTSSTRLSEQQHQLSNMITSNPNCSSSTLFSTNLSSFSFQTQDHYNLVGYNSYEYPNLKENSNLNLLMFGSEGSCSTSSEGSCSYQIKQEEIIGSAAAFQDQMIGQRFMLNYGGGYDCNYQNLWGQKSNGGFGEGLLDQYHVLEDLKQLLSSSSTSNSQGNNLIVNGSNNFFNVDENKTQEKVMYF